MGIFLGGHIPCMYSTDANKRTTFARIWKIVANPLKALPSMRKLEGLQYCLFKYKMFINFPILCKRNRKFLKFILLPITTLYTNKLF